MDMNNVNIEEIVKQVLSGMTGNAPAAAAATSAPAAPAGNTIPKKARVAMMTEKKHFEDLRAGLVPGAPAVEAELHQGEGGHCEGEDCGHCKYFKNEKR